MPSWKLAPTSISAPQIDTSRATRKDGVIFSPYAPNTPETIIAFLAAASLGAIWSVCSPDMGLNAVLDRFRQIEPKALFAVPSCDYNGKHHDKGEVLAQMIAALPTLTDLILMPGISAHAMSANVRIGNWTEIVVKPASLFPKLTLALV